MKNVIYSLIITILSLTNFAWAADSEGKFIIHASGADSCGKFNNAVAKGNNEGNWSKWNEYTAYTYGYFTGVNRYRNETYKITGNTDQEGIMGFIEKYCKENPLSDYYDAMRAVESRLHENRIRHGDDE